MKKALLIGINYRGTQSELNGCINDVNNVRDHLLTIGYTIENITILTDDTAQKPNRNEIIVSMLNLLLSNATELFFHYSGHGSYVTDHNQDEQDHKDECIVPLDYQTAGFITDDQLRGLLNFLKPAAKLTIILDCCHSGTGFDLAYNIKQRLRWKRERRRWIRRRVNKMVKNRKYLQTNGQVVMISGCQDPQYSADAYEEGQYQGAMTFSLLQALNDESVSNWEELFLKIRQVLKERGYPQLPHLTSGKPLNLNGSIAL